MVLGRDDRISRRELLRWTLGAGAALAGGGVLATCSQPAGPGTATGATLPPPETTTVRWVSPPPCDPLWIAKDYLLEEGFTDLQIVRITPTTTEWLTTDKADFNTGGYPSLIAANVDAGLPIVTLAGIHPGCFELFATPGIATIRDLRGKTIAVNAKNVSDQFYGFFGILLAYVGVDPRTEVNFIEVPPDSAALRDAFLDGRSQAFIAPAASGPLLRRNPKNPGKVILDTTMDKPWSQYYCCNLVANRDWVRRHPIATKRFTRAILRASDVVAKDKTRAAREYVAGGFNSTTASPVDEDLTNEVIRDLSYDWRELDPEETLRFFALRLADAKLIKSTPQQIIAQSSDFAYMRQLRTELKL
ncbi:MAG TPA: ABC transporter substrate-binding protein [Candidatus Limnocylindria bacterium]|nr:ABC transporter substrate-binding protein [Candidatus Limnocylindria bacterium]